FVVSAKDRGALVEQARRLAEQARTRPLGAADVAYTLARRTHHGERLALVAEDLAELAARLEAFAEHGRAPELVSGSVDETRLEALRAAAADGGGLPFAAPGATFAAAAREP